MIPDEKSGPLAMATAYCSSNNNDEEELACIKAPKQKVDSIIMLEQTSGSRELDKLSPINVVDDISISPFACLTTSARDVSLQLVQSGLANGKPRELKLEKVHWEPEWNATSTVGSVAVDVAVDPAKADEKIQLLQQQQTERPLDGSSSVVYPTSTSLFAHIHEVRCKLGQLAAKLEGVAQLEPQVSKSNNPTSASQQANKQQVMSSLTAAFAYSHIKSAHSGQQVRSDEECEDTDGSTRSISGESLDGDRQLSLDGSCSTESQTEQSKRRANALQMLRHLMERRNELKELDKQLFDIMAHYISQLNLATQRELSPQSPNPLLHPKLSHYHPSADRVDPREALSGCGSAIDLTSANWSKQLSSRLEVSSRADERSLETNKLLKIDSNDHSKETKTDLMQQRKPSVNLKKSRLLEAVNLSSQGDTKAPISRQPTSLHLEQKAPFHLNLDRASAYCAEHKRSSPSLQPLVDQTAIGVIVGGSLFSLAGNPQAQHVVQQPPPDDGPAHKKFRATSLQPRVRAATFGECRPPTLQEATRAARFHSTPILLSTSEGFQHQTSWPLHSENPYSANQLSEHSALGCCNQQQAHTAPVLPAEHENVFALARQLHKTSSISLAQPQEPNLFNEQYLMRDQLSQQLKKQVAFQCHVCGSGFDDRHRLQQHLSIHLNLHASWFEEKMIKETMAQYESKRGDYLCTTCQMRFETTAEFDKHMHFHAEKPHQCELCARESKPVSFRYYRQLLTHLRSHCFLYSCRFAPDCKQTANRKDYLKLHILKHHLNNKLPEQYTICCH